MLLQIDTVALAEELIQAEEPIQESINLWQMAQYGGWIMIILAILLAGACYIFIARLWSSSRPRVRTSRSWSA